MFLNNCTNILVSGFAYFLSDFSKSRSSDLKAKKYFKNISQFKGEHLCPSLLLKLQNVLKKRLCHRSFSVNFTKFLRNVLQKLCYVEPLQRFANEIAKFQATSPLFIKESVVFHCFSIKNDKTWYFRIHLLLIQFQIILPKHIFDYNLFQKKHKQGGGVQDMEFEEKEVKKEVDFLGVIKKN